MSNLTWLTEATRKKSEDIMDLSDEYWDTILGDIKGAPKELEESPHALGKFAVVSALGLMLYMPGNARQIADSFGRDANTPTGTINNVNGRGYMPKVSQGIEAAARTITRWEEGLGQAPDLSKTETTEDLRNFMPLFEELLSDRVARQRAKEEELAATQPDDEASLLASTVAPEEEDNV